MCDELDNIILSNTNLSDKIKEINKVHKWYHNIYVKKIYTKGNPGPPSRGKNWKKIINELPNDLTGKTVLDIGCNEGALSIEAKKRNAKYVLGIDYGVKFIKKAKFIAKELNLEIDYKVANIEDREFLYNLPKFDIICFIGIFYHLSDCNVPLYLSKLYKERFIFETATTKLKINKPIIELNEYKNGSPGLLHLNTEGIIFLIKKHNLKDKHKIVFEGGRTCVSFWK